jgi:hypothetical protein
MISIASSDGANTPSPEGLAKLLDCAREGEFPRRNCAHRPVGSGMKKQDPPTWDTYRAGWRLIVIEPLRAKDKQTSRRHRRCRPSRIPAH